jgi:hypothetical protein
MTTQEQIKQCEDIIENGGECPSMVNLCIECCIVADCVPNGDTSDKACFNVAKSKLKQLRGENMNIKIDDIIKSINQCVEQMKKLKEVKKEQEIEFVVGGEYDTDNGKRVLIHSFYDEYTYCTVGKYNGMLMVTTKDKYEEEMKEIMEKYNYKYTGRTLSDILNKE